MTKEMLLEIKEQELEERGWKEILKEKYHRAMERYKSQFILLLVFFIVVFIITIMTVVPPFNEPDKVYYVAGTTDDIHGWGDPTPDHPLGTDHYGRDQLTRLLFAVRNSLAFGFITGCLCIGLAIGIGIFGPFKGGVADTTSSFVTNIALTFPQIPFILFMAAILKTREWWVTMLVIGLFTWPWAARSIRSQVLTLKERNYIKVARMSGLKDSKIAFGEVLPNILPYILLAFIILLGNAIVIEAGIAMIGLGQTNYLTLGYLLNDAITNEWIIPKRMYALWIPPGLALIFIYLSLFLIHSSVSQTFEQRKV